MDKKRKRASFSLTADPPPKPSSKVTEAVQDEPSVKQVVEVVVIPQPTVVPPKVDKDVQEAVVSMPNLIDDGTEEEAVLPKKQQEAAVQFTEEELETEEEKEEETEQDAEDEKEEDDSIVTASATPQGDTIVVRNDPEIEEQFHKKIRVNKPMPQPVEQDEDQELNEEKTEDEDQVHTQKPPAMKIHTGMHQREKDTEREEAVAELFGSNAQSVMPEITVHTHTQTKGIILWALTMVAVALGVGGGLVLFSNRSNKPINPNVVTAPSPEVTSPPAQSPTPSPTPVAVKRSEIRIQVLNGGGKAGAGSRMKSFLEEKGYRVVETKNADSYSYETTEIIVKESKSSIIDTLAQDLEESYELGESKTDLPESSNYDARVIVGENE